VNNLKKIQGNQPIGSSSHDDWLKKLVLMFFLQNLVVTNDSLEIKRICSTNVLKTQMEYLHVYAWLMVFYVYGTPLKNSHGTPKWRFGR